MRMKWFYSGGCAPFPNPLVPPLSVYPAADPHSGDLTPASSLTYNWNPPDASTTFLL
jgi:hypothetical protein